MSDKVDVYDNRPKKKLPPVLVASVVIGFAIVIIAISLFLAITRVNNRFEFGELSEHAYENTGVGLNLDFGPEAVFLGSNIGSMDYQFEVLGNEWLRLGFSDPAASAMDVRLRISDVGDQGRLFVIQRFLANYRRYGSSFRPSNELDVVLSNSGLSGTFSVFKREELVRRDIQESETFMLLKHHGNVLIQIYIRRYSGELAEYLESVLQGLEVYAPSAPPAG